MQQVWSYLFLLIELASEVICSSSFPSPQQPRLPCPSINQFWDSKLNFCVPCRVCTLVTIRECSATTNTVCGNSYTQGVKERVKNASTSKKELFQRWKGRGRAGGNGRYNNNNGDIVNGMIKYSEDDSVGTLRSRAPGQRRGPGNDLHSDLKAIERELILGESRESGEMMPDSLAATGTPQIVIGKKRFYEDEPFDIDVANEQQYGDDMYADGSAGSRSTVYGQVVDNPLSDNHYQQQHEEQQQQQLPPGAKHGFVVTSGEEVEDDDNHDEFGLLHSILQERKAKEAAAAAAAEKAKLNKMDGRKIKYVNIYCGYFSKQIKS